MPVKRIAITNAAGKVAYHLLFRLAKGELFGPTQSVALHLIDHEDNLKKLESLVMELEDCGFELLSEVQINHESHQTFAEVDFVFLLDNNSAPICNKKQSLEQNIHLLASQARAIASQACHDVKILVATNPYNSSAWIVYKSAPDLIAKNIHGLSRLDQNRAQALLAKKTGQECNHVTPPLIWAGQGDNVVLDWSGVEINSGGIKEMIELEWLKNDFQNLVRGRTQTIIETGRRSANASLASAIVLAAYDLVHPTPKDKFYSSIAYSESNNYGVDPDLFFAFPCRTYPSLITEIIEGYGWDLFTRQNIEAVEKELIIEREWIRPKLR